MFVGVILGEPALARSPKAAKVRVSAPTPGVRCRHIGSVYLLDVDRGAEATFAQLQRDLGMLPTTRRYVSPAGSGAVYSARGGEPL